MTGSRPRGGGGVMTGSRARGGSGVMTVLDHPAVMAA